MTKRKVRPDLTPVLQQIVNDNPLELDGYIPTEDEETEEPPRAMPKPWEKLPTESSKAFSAFQVYLNQPATSRSVIGAYRVLYRQDATRIPGGFAKWTMDYSWTLRAGKWDEHVAAETRAEEVKAAKAAAKRRMDAYNTLLTVGLTIISKANLKDMQEDMARSLLTSSIQFIDQGSRGHRLEAGEPTDNAMVTVNQLQGNTAAAIGERTLESIIRGSSLLTLSDTEGED